jgi:DnaJ-class molecular chaperone
MSDQEPDAEAQPRECLACRGTGKVLSKKGGDEAQVDCPWCDGTGTVSPGHDAQARWR